MSATRSSLSAAQLVVDFPTGKSIPAETLARMRALIREHGVVHVRGLLAEADLAPLQQQLRRLIELRIAADGSVNETDNDSLHRFDDGFIPLNRRSRDHGGVIYRASRRLAANVKLTMHPSIQAVAQGLLGEMIIMSEDRSVRIDHPREDDYLFPWHQDFPFNMDSEDAIVFWIPLQDVDKENGALRVAVGSHRLGLQPLRVVDSRNQRKNRAYALEIADPSVADQFAQLALPAKLGDALIFHTMLLHRSSPNTSTRARWTVQIRIGNFEHPEAIRRNWPGPMAANPFETVYPDAVVSE